MLLGGIVGMLIGMLGVRMGNVGVMRGAKVVARLMMFRSFGVVVCGQSQMMGSLLMVMRSFFRHGGDLHSRRQT